MSKSDVAHFRKTHRSLEPIGPSLGSYRPPLVGRLRLSSKIGLSTFLTEMALMSSAERKEKDREDTSEWIECEMSMMYLCATSEYDEGARRFLRMDIDIQGYLQYKFGRRDKVRQTFAPSPSLCNVLRIVT